MRSCVPVSSCRAVSRCPSVNCGEVVSCLWCVRGRDGFAGVSTFQVPSVTPRDRRLVGVRAWAAGVLVVRVAAGGARVFWVCFERKSKENRGGGGACVASLPLRGVLVRRRATLPHPVGCSTIAVPGLRFRVRNGSGRLPWAMAAANL